MDLHIFIATLKNAHSILCDKKLISHTIFKMSSVTIKRPIFPFFLALPPSLRLSLSLPLFCDTHARTHTFTNNYSLINQSGADAWNSSNLCFFTQQKVTSSNLGACNYFLFLKDGHGHIYQKYIYQKWLVNPTNVVSQKIDLPLAHNTFVGVKK